MKINKQRNIFALTSITKNLYFIKFELNAMSKIKGGEGTLSNDE